MTNREFKNFGKFRISDKKIVNFLYFAYVTTGGFAIDGQVPVVLRAFFWFFNIYLCALVPTTSGVCLYRALTAEKIDFVYVMISSVQVSIVPSVFFGYCVTFLCRNELKTMLKLIDCDFHIDWEKISQPPVTPKMVVNEKLSFGSWAAVMRVVNGVTFAFFFFLPIGAAIFEIWRSGKAPAYNSYIFYTSPLPFVQNIDSFGWYVGTYFVFSLALVLAYTVGMLLPLVVVAMGGTFYNQFVKLANTIHNDGLVFKKNLEKYECSVQNLGTLDDRIQKERMSIQFSKRCLRNLEIYRKLYAHCEFFVSVYFFS